MNGRLSKGEKARSIEIREASKRKMAIHKYEWVQSLTQGLHNKPIDFDKFTLQNLCDYQNQNLNLEPLNLNTFKKHITTEFNEDAVKNVKDWLHQINSSSSNKKTSSHRETNLKLKLEKKELKIQIQVLTDDLVSLRYGYLKLLDTIESLSIKDRSIRDAIKAHRKHINLRSVLKTNHEKS